MLTLRPSRRRQLSRTLLSHRTVENDSPAVLVGDDVVDRQRLRRGSGNCCNILGVGFVLGIRIAVYASNAIRVVVGIRLGFEMDGSDLAARSRRSAVARSRMARG